MAFDADKFMAAQFKPREVNITLPSLASFFPPGEEPVFTVRGLTGSELARVNEAVDRGKVLSAIVEGVMTGTRQAAVDSVRSMIGLDDAVPGEAVRRIELLIEGSVTPKLDRPTIVKLLGVFPVEVYQLTNEIIKLTGLGHESAEGK